MSAITYRANLSAKAFPFVSTYQGRTVIVQGPDNTFNRQVSSSVDGDRDVGIPQLYYCHNVLPTAQGFQSVAYNTKVAAFAVPGAAPTKLNVYPWVSSDGVLGQLMHVVVGNNVSYYVRDDLISPAWRLLSSVNVAPGLASSTFSCGNINGISYGFSRRASTVGAVVTDLFSVTFSVLTLNSQVIVGGPANPLGFAAISGYGVLWESSAIYWSSSINFLDYTPSLVTGAGGGGVQAIRGYITYVAPAGFGAVVYTQVSAVAMTYTGNSRYPFTFQEIKGSGGNLSYDLIAFDANSQSQVAVTTRGLQSLSAQIASAVLPELSDFLVSKIFEDFDETTNLLTQTNLSIVVTKKFTLITDRFLVISYGATSGAAFTHAIVYDLVLKRYGKLKLTHWDCFECIEVLLAGDNSGAPLDALYTGIAFIASDYTTKQIAFFHGATTEGGVFILGKYQYVRSRKLQLDKVTIENVESGNTVTCIDMYAQDGKNTLNLNGYPLENIGNQRVYSFENAVAMNHSIVLKGPINLSSMVLDFHTHGKTNI